MNARNGHNLLKKIHENTTSISSKLFRSSEIETEVLLVCGHSLTYNQLKMYLKASFAQKHNLKPLICPVEECDEKLKLISNYTPDEAKIYEKCILRISQYNSSVRRRSRASDELLGYLNN